MESNKLKSILIYFILTISAFISIYPLLWMIGASLKLPNEVMSTYKLWPDVWQWKTYVEVWQKIGFFKYFLNSVNVILWSILGINIVFSMAGFAFSKLKFPGRNTIFYMFMGIMFVPGITMLIPLYLTLNYLKLINTHTGMILAFINGAAPFAIFLFRNYFSTISNEIYESAKIDGASIFRILFNIYFPLALPAMATITTMNFINIWNNLSLPLVVLNSKSLHTLPVAVMNLDSSTFRKWNVLMAGSLFSIIPVILAFFFLQKYYVKGLTSGAVKG